MHMHKMNNYINLLIKMSNILLCKSMMKLQKVLLGEIELYANKWTPSIFFVKSH